MENQLRRTRPFAGPISREGQQNPLPPPVDPFDPTPGENPADRHRCGVHDVTPRQHDASERCAAEVLIQVLGDGLGFG